MEWGFSVCSRQEGTGRGSQKRGTVTVRDVPVAWMLLTFLVRFFSKLFNTNSHNQDVANRNSGRRNVLPAVGKHSQGCQGSRGSGGDGALVQKAQSDGNQRCCCRMSIPEQDPAGLCFLNGWFSPAKGENSTKGCPELFWGPRVLWQRLGLQFPAVAVFSLPPPHPCLLHTADSEPEHTHGK